MRKIIVSEMLSVDGFFAGPKGEIDWHVVDEEFNGFAIDLLNTVDTVLLGRVTFKLFEDYWPAAARNPATAKSDREIARLLSAANKIVFSKTREETAWENTRFANELMPAEINAMKQRAGKNMVVYGSGIVVSQLAQMGLIDRYRFFVNPVILGEGRTLIQGIRERIHLKLLDTRRFGSGNVMLDYASS